MHLDNGNSCLILVSNAGSFFRKIIPRTQRRYNDARVQAADDATGFLINGPFSNDMEFQASVKSFSICRT